MSEQLKAALAGLIRHGLTTAGGYLVGAGFIDATQAESLVGAGMVLFGIAWSLIQKRAKKAPA